MKCYEYEPWSLDFKTFCSFNYSRSVKTSSVCHFTPSLTFASKAGVYAIGATLWQAPTFVCKYSIRVEWEVTERDKHPRLMWYGIDHRHKSFKYRPLVVVILLLILSNLSFFRKIAANFQARLRATTSSSTPASRPGFNLSSLFIFATDGQKCWSVCTWQRG